VTLDLCRLSVLGIYLYIVISLCCYWEFNTTAIALYQKFPFRFYRLSGSIPNSRSFAARRSARCASCSARCASHSAASSGVGITEKEFRIQEPESSLGILWDWMENRGLEQAILNASEEKILSVTLPLT